MARTPTTPKSIIIDGSLMPESYQSPRKIVIDSITLGLPMTLFRGIALLAAARCSPEPWITLVQLYGEDDRGRRYLHRILATIHGIAGNMIAAKSKLPEATILRLWPVFENGRPGEVRLMADPAAISFSTNLLHVPDEDIQNAYRALNLVKGKR